MDNPFFEQLVQRIEGDRKALNQTADILRGMIDRKMWQKITGYRDLPTDLDRLEEVFYRQQIFFRQFQLEGRWWSRCSGKILAFTKEGDRPVILSPRFADYSFILPQTGRRCSARKDGSLLKPEAFSLCYPLPDGKMTISSFLWYALRQLNAFDYVCAFLACLGVVLLTMVTPYICKLTNIM